MFLADEESCIGLETIRLSSLIEALNFSVCSIIQVGFNVCSIWVSGGRRRYIHVVQGNVNLKRLCNVLFIGATATAASTGDSFVVCIHAFTSNRVLFRSI